MRIVTVRSGDDSAMVGIDAGTDAPFQTSSVRLGCDEGVSCCVQASGGFRSIRESYDIVCVVYSGVVTIQLIVDR